MSTLAANLKIKRHVSMATMFESPVIFFTWKTLSDNRRLYLHVKNETYDPMLMD